MRLIILACFHCIAIQLLFANFVLVAPMSWHSRLHVVHVALVLCEAQCEGQRRRESV